MLDARYKTKLVWHTDRAILFHGEDETINDVAVITHTATVHHCILLQSSIGKANWGGHGQNVNDEKLLRLFIKEKGAHIYEPDSPLNWGGEPDAGHNYEVAQYYFTPPEIIVDPPLERVFQLTVYRDRTCSWLYLTGGIGAEKIRNLLANKEISEEGAERLAQRERDERMIHATIGDDVYWVLAEQQAIRSNGMALTDEITESINKALAPYFWRDVNPLLPDPLPKIQPE